MYIHTYVCTQFHTHSHTHTHTRTRARAHVHTYIRTCICTYTLQSHLDHASWLCPAPILNAHHSYCPFVKVCTIRSSVTPREDWEWTGDRWTRNRMREDYWKLKQRKEVTGKLRRKWQRAGYTSAPPPLWARGPRHSLCRHVLYVTNCRIGHFVYRIIQLTST